MVIHDLMQTRPDLFDPGRSFELMQEATNLHLRRNLERLISLDNACAEIAMEGARPVYELAKHLMELIHDLTQKAQADSEQVWAGAMNQEQWMASDNALWMQIEGQLATYENAVNWHLNRLL
jgi:hypothetical protein